MGLLKQITNAQRRSDWTTFEVKEEEFESFLAYLVDDDLSLKNYLIDDDAVNRNFLVDDW